MALPRFLRPPVAWFSRTAFFRRVGPSIMPPLERDTVLMYCPDGDEFLVTGSNFARDAHPAWTGNLIAHPEAAVSLRGHRIPVRARMLDDAEREEAWPKLERNWPGYRRYEQTAGRTLRVFRLTRR